MLFKKKKELNEDERIEQYGKLALTSLIPLCKEGQIKEDSFEIEDKGLCVFADVLSLENNVAQIVYQLHHDWFEEPVMESVAASGESVEEAIHLAVLSFYDNVLAVFLQAIDQPESGKAVRVMTQEPHDYCVYRGNVNGVGRREGMLEGDFWDLLQEDILLNVANQKAYWVKVFTSKKKNNVICEVRINNNEIPSMSEKMVSYAEKWECKDAYHTEKQGILLIQNQESYQELEFGKEEIIKLCEEAIPLFENCEDKESYLAIRKKLYSLCKDQSLTHEVFFLIPELYCEYAYPQVEFKDKIFLLRKGEKGKEIRQSQLYSFTHIQACVQQHLKENKPSQDCIERVLQHSANARAIQKAIDEGNDVNELLIPGIGILVPADYKLR